MNSGQSDRVANAMTTPGDRVIAVRITDPLVLNPTSVGDGESAAASRQPGRGFDRGKSADAVVTQERGADPPQHPRRLQSRHR